MPSSNLAITDLLLQEIKLFQQDVKQRLQQLFENVETLLLSNQLNITSGNVENVKPCFPSGEDERSKISLVISNKYSNYTKVIDLNNFFDGLEDLPSTISSSMPFVSDQANSDMEISSSISGNKPATKPICIEKIIIEDSSDDEVSNVAHHTPQKKKSRKSIGKRSINNSEFSAPNLDFEAGAMQNPTVMNDYLSQSSLFEQQKETTATALNVDLISLAAGITEVVDPKSGQKLFECPVCNKRSKTMNDLIRHLKIHSGERPYSCIFCSKAFKRSSHMQSHMQIHTGEKPFKCDQCPKAFYNKWSLKYHKVTHDVQARENRVKGDLTGTKDRPYACNFCDRLFRQKSHRDLHVRIHLNENRFECIVCNKKFKRKEHMTNHMRTHTGEKPYKCDTCCKCFSDKSSLVKHRKSLHCIN